MLSLPRSARLAAVAGALGPLGAGLLASPAAAQASTAPPLPLPPGIDPIVGWMLILLASSAAPPAAWLAWQVAKIGGRLGAAAVEALAAWILFHTKRTPSPLDDGPGAAIAAELMRQAAELRKATESAGAKKKDGEE